MLWVQHLRVQGSKGVVPWVPRGGCHGCHGRCTNRAMLLGHATGPCYQGHATRFQGSKGPRVQGSKCTKVPRFQGSRFQMYQFSAVFSRFQPFLAGFSHFQPFSAVFSRFRPFYSRFQPFYSRFPPFYRRFTMFPQNLNFTYHFLKFSLNLNFYLPLF